MKQTWQESADLKQALKHDAETPEIAAEARAHPLEASEAYLEVEANHDTCTPGSWVANRMAEAAR